MTSSEGAFDSIALSAIMGEVFSQTGEMYLLLTVSDGESEKYFLFENDSITLFSIGPRKQALLGDVLVKTLRISEEQLAEALEEQRRTKDYLGNILINKGYAGKETIQAAVREQIFEELFDLITWENAEYFFKSLDPKKEKIPAFDDPAVRATKCEFNTHLLAAEVCKQLEHWEIIRDELPFQMEVPVRTDENTAPDAIPDLDEFSRRLLMYMDGCTPISSLAVRAGMSLFRAYISLDKLVSGGHIRYLSSSEIRKLADALPSGHPALTEWNLDECADAVERREIVENSVRSIYNVFVLEKDLSEEQRAALETQDPGGVITRLFDGANNVKEVAARIRKDVVEICGVIGRLVRESIVRPATPSELREKATELQIQGDLDRAVDLLKWAVKLTPDDSSLMQELAIVSAARGNRRLAAAYYRKLAHMAIEQSDFEQAVTALSRVAELAPESYEVNKELAGVYLKRGEEYREQALAEFGQALAKLALCGLYDQSRQVADELLQLIPDHEELKAQLVDLIAKIESAGHDLKGICPQCKAPVNEGDKECIHCGAPLFHNCMTCGKELRIGTFICPECGKDPYALPRKGQKGYTLRIKKAEGESGVMRFKLFNALAKARKAVAAKQFTKAIEDIEKIQQLQPYNEVLKTELEEIKKLAEEHERHKDEIEEELTVKTSPKKMVKRFLAILSAAVIIIAGTGILLFFLLRSGADEKAYEILSARVARYENSSDPVEIAQAMKDYRGFLAEFPDSELASQVKRKLGALRKKYEKLAEPHWKEIAPALKRYSGKTPDAVLKSLGKGELDRIRALRKKLDEFLRLFPESSNAAAARKSLKVLTQVVAKASATGEKDIAEKNAAEALAKARRIAAEEGFAKAKPAFERVAAKFKGTFAATQAEQEIRKYDAFVQKLGEALKKARELVSAGRFAAAGEMIDSFQIEYPSAPGVAELKALAEEIAAKRKEFDRRVDELAAKWERGEMRVREYESEIASLLDKYKNSGWEERLRGMQIELANFVKEAELLRKRAESAVEKKDYQQAFLLHKRLIENYHQAVDLGNILIHFWLHSDPSGAEVFAPRGGTLQHIGRTPCIVTVPYLDGKGKAVYILRKRGFVDKKVVIESSEVMNNDYFNYPLIKLISTYSFRWEVAGGITNEPVRLHTGRTGKLAFARNFGVVFLDISDGSSHEITLITPRKERPLESDPRRMTIAGDKYWQLTNPLQKVRLETKRLNGTFLALPATDGRVYLIDPVSEKVAASFGLKYAYNLHAGVVFRRIPLLMNRTFGYFAAIDGKVYCCDVESGEIRWTFTTGSKGRISLYGGDKYLFVRLANGRTLVLDYSGDATTGTTPVLAEFFCDALLLQGGHLYSLSGGKVQVRDAGDQNAQLQATFSGKFSIDAYLHMLGDIVVAVEPRTGSLSAFRDDKRLWILTTGETLGSPPIRMGGNIVLAFVSGRVALVDAATGRIVKENRYEHQWMGKIVVEGERLYLHDVDSSVVVLEPRSNRIVWSNSDIKGERIIDLLPEGGNLYVITERAVYYFERIFNE